MREIKFRAWDASHNEMEYIEDFYWFEESGVHDSAGSGHYGKYILMEFTGLRDMKGNDIYENDLVYAFRNTRTMLLSLENTKSMSKFTQDGI